MGEESGGGGSGRSDCCSQRRRSRLHWIKCVACCPCSGAEWLSSQLTAAAMATSRGSSDTCGGWQGMQISCASDGRQARLQNAVGRSSELLPLQAPSLTGCRSVMYTIVLLQDRPATLKGRREAQSASPRLRGQRQRERREASHMWHRCCQPVQAPHFRSLQRSRGRHQLTAVGP